MLHGGLAQAAGGFDQGRGLLAQYYNDGGFSDLKVSRIDPSINFHWGRRSPAPRKVERNGFAVRWSGQVVPHTSERYTFRIRADDGVCVWLNGRSVVERMYARGGAATNTFSADLIEGRRYDVRIDYCDRSGGAGVKLTWSAAGVRRQVIPAAQLFAAEPVPTPLPLEPSQAGVPTIQWTEVAPLPVPRSEHMGAVVNGKLYVFGGYVDLTFKPTRRSDVYNPVTNTWTRLADLPVGVTHAGTVADGTSIYFAGGYPETATFQTFATTTVWRYDVAANRFSSMPALPAARGGGALALLGRELHYFGGSDAARADSALHWALDLDDLAGGWVAKSPLLLARNHVGGVTVGDKVYAVGGQEGQNMDASFRPEVDVYDAATDTWSPAAPLPAPPRSHITNATFVWNGQILTFGGQTTGQNVITDVSCYDPTRNLWGTPFHLPAPRLSGVAGALADGRFIFCGGSSSAGLQSNVWIGQIM